MVHPILMPKPGQMTEECTVIAWHKKEGDVVRKGDVLFEIETDKSAMEVESFEEGVLLRRLVADGETVPVNAVCAYIGTPGEAIPEAAAAPAPMAAPAAIAAAPAVVPAVASPAALAPAPSIAPPSNGPEHGPGRPRISPRARRMAAEARIDPRLLVGTGPLGRVTERDVRSAIERAGDREGAAATTPAARVAPAEGEEEARPFSRMRRVIADRLTHSWTSTPHFTVTVSVDVTRLLALRAELKTAGTNLTVTDFVLSATAQSLVEFPDVNSRTDGVSVWPHRHVHLGVAVSLPAGLVVPVIRDADRLAVGEIHDRAVALAAAARQGTLGVDDMTGSTFTVSNLGMFGVEEFSAIINPGEAAILAVSSALATPVAMGDGLAVRQVMKLTLSADHRIVDGEMGARFLNAIRRRLEDAASLRNEALNA